MKQKAPSLPEKLMYEQVAACRESEGRDAKTTFGIVYAQSVKNTDTADEKGYDAGKNSVRDQAAHSG